MSAVRVCAWCRGALPSSSRVDALTCSKRCRQARNRFVRQVGKAPEASNGSPRRIAYADPPYPGLSARYYSDHPDFAGEVDHQELIDSLVANYDAWALSTSAAALPDILRMCPTNVRIAAWHRGERPHHTAVTPLNAWEPVILGGDLTRRGDQVSRVDEGHVEPAARSPRDMSSRQAGATRRVDSLYWISRPRLTDPDRVIGSKPAVFARWIFELLGATPADTFVDVFPGSGGISRAWRSYTTEGGQLVPT